MGDELESQPGGARPGLCLRKALALKQRPDLAKEVDQKLAAVAQVELNPPIQTARRRFELGSARVSLTGAFRLTNMSSSAFASIGFCNTGTMAKRGSMLAEP